MPITGTAAEILADMVRRHGKKDGTRMFYATANARSRRPEDWSKKEAASLGHMELPMPHGGTARFHVTGPQAADPRFIASQAQQIASQVASHGQKLTQMGVLHPSDHEAWAHGAMNNVLKNQGIGVHRVLPGEPQVMGSHFGEPPPATPVGANGASGMTTRAMKAACGEMGPWTIISQEGTPVTVESKFEYGQGLVGFVGVDDNCYTIWHADGNGRYMPSTHLWPEAVAAIQALPTNPADLSSSQAFPTEEAPHGEQPDASFTGPEIGEGMHALQLNAPAQPEHIEGGPGAGVPDEAVPAKPLENGAKIEAMEHTDGDSPKDLEVGKEIAKDHLVEKGEEAAKEYSDGEAEKAEKKAPKIEAMEGEAHEAKETPAEEKAEKASGDKKVAAILPF